MKTSKNKAEIEEVDLEGSDLEFPWELVQAFRKHSLAVAKYIINEELELGRICFSGSSLVAFVEYKPAAENAEAPLIKRSFTAEDMVECLRDNVYDDDDPTAGIDAAIAFAEDLLKLLKAERDTRE